MESTAATVYPAAAHLRHSGSCANIRFRGFRYLHVVWIFMFPESFAYNREVMQTVNSCVPFGPFPSPPYSCPARQT